MTKSELNSAISAKANISATQVNNVVEALVAVIGEQLLAGEKVAINGLGIFEVKAKAERVGVNPRSGEKITIAASKSISFKPAKAIKDSLNG